MRGKSLTVDVPKKNATASMLLEAGAEKHKAHSKDIIKQQFKYALLYGDGNEIKTLKESSEAFECGKPYHRLNFFLCEALEFSQTTLERFIESNPESTLSSEENIEEDIVEQVHVMRIKRAKLLSVFEYPGTFQGSKNGVVLKTSQKVCFDDNFSCCQRHSFPGRHLRQAPTHISGKKQNFLVVVVHTWNKTWRRRKEERRCVTVPFSLPALGVLGRMCCEDFEMCCEDFEMCCEDFEMCCEDFRICSGFKMCFEEFGMCCA